MPWTNRAVRCGLVALLLGLSPAAAAQSYSDPGPGIGIHIGASKGLDATASGLSGGLQVRARLTGGIGLDGLFGYRREEYASAGVPALRLEIVPVQASVLAFLLHETPVQPYLLGGVGYYWVRTAGLGANTGAGSSTASRFSFHAGAGVDARAGRRLSVFGELRYVFFDLPAVDELRSLDGLERKAEFWSAVLGLNLYF